MDREPKAITFEHQAGKLPPDVFYCLYAAAASLRQQEESLFPQSPSVLDLGGLTKSNLVTRPPVKPTGQPAIDSVIEEIIKKGANKGGGREKQNYFSNLGDALLNVFSGLPAKDQESYLSLVKALSKIDNKLPGGVNYILPLVNRIVCFASNLGDGEIGVREIAQILGVDLSLMIIFLTHLKRFGIKDFFRSDLDLREEWSNFSLPHLSFLLPLLRVISDQLSRQFSDIAMRDLLKINNLLQSLNLLHFFNTRGIVGDSMDAFIPGGKGALALIGAPKIVFFRVPFNEEVGRWLTNCLTEKAVPVPLVVFLKINGIQYEPVIKLVRPPKHPSTSDELTLELVWANRDNALASSQTSSFPTLVDENGNRVLRLSFDEISAIGLPLYVSPSSWQSSNCFTKRNGLPPIEPTELLKITST